MYLCVYLSGTSEKIRQKILILKAITIQDVTAKRKARDRHQILYSIDVSKKA